MNDAPPVDATLLMVILWDGFPIANGVDAHALSAVNVGLAAVLFVHILGGTV